MEDFEKAYQGIATASNLTALVLNALEELRADINDDRIVSIMLQVTAQESALMDVGVWLYKEHGEDINEVHRRWNNQS